MTGHIDLETFIDRMARLRSRRIDGMSFTRNETDGIEAFAVSAGVRRLQLIRMIGRRRAEIARDAAHV